MITDYTIRDKCSNCGACCSDFLPLSDNDIRRIKAYIAENHIKEQRHNYIQGYDMTCPFRDEANKKCLIYKIRPAICKQFMCNHTIKDIQKTKKLFHQKYAPVNMRAVFFGSNELERLLNEEINKGNRHCTHS